jgi:hypothetical protein
MQLVYKLNIKSTRAEHPVPSPAGIHKLHAVRRRVAASLFLRAGVAILHKAGGAPEEA